MSISCRVHFDMLCTIFVKNPSEFHSSANLPPSSRSFNHLSHSSDCLTPALIPFAPISTNPSQIKDVCIIEFKFVPSQLKILAGSAVLFKLNTPSNYHKLNCEREFTGVCLNHQKVCFSHTFMHQGTHRVYDEVFPFLECTIVVEAHEVPLSERCLNGGGKMSDKVTRNENISKNNNLNYLALRGSFPSVSGPEKVSSAPAKGEMSNWLNKGSHQFVYASADGCLEVSSVGSSTPHGQHVSKQSSQHIKVLDNDHEANIENKKRKKRLRMKNRKQKLAREKQMKSHAEDIDGMPSPSVESTRDVAAQGITTSEDTQFREKKDDIVELLEASLHRVKVTVADMRQHRSESSSAVLQKALDPLHPAEDESESNRSVAVCPSRNVEVHEPSSLPACSRDCGKKGCNGEKGGMRRQKSHRNRKYCRLTKSSQHPKEVRLSSVRIDTSSAGICPPTFGQQTNADAPMSAIEVFMLESMYDKCFD